MALGPAFDNVLPAAQAGAAWAWDRIFRDLAPVVRGYLRAKGASQPDDLTSEVFLQIARNIHGFEGDESGFRSWVFTIAHHRLIDERRRRSRRPVVPTDEETLAALADTVGGNVEEEALAADEMERVARLLEGLTEDQRTVMLLRVVADLSLEEVAQIMGKRVNAVKALQHRATRRLHKKHARPVTPADPVAVTEVT